MSARILSVNITEPRIVTIKGRDVETSIFKRAHTEPVFVDAQGFRGERRISPRLCDPEDHAVYMYPHEHYATWEAELAEAGFEFGQFGENLTTVGLSENEVRLGDVLRCGGTTLQVRQPRLPCRKLNVRMGRRFAGRFLRSRRLGFFLRVLESGCVQPGDPIEIVRRDESAPTIDELIRISQIDYWDTVGLEGLLGCDRLPPAWRESLRDKLEVARRAEGWHGLREFEVVRRRDEGDGWVSLWLACTVGRPLAPFQAGQYLTVAWRLADDSVTRRRYAITSRVDELEHYGLMVRKPARGSGSDGDPVSAALAAAKVGDRLRAAAPRGDATPSSVTVEDQKP